MKNPNGSFRIIPNEKNQQGDSQEFSYRNFEAEELLLGFINWVDRHSWTDQVPPEEKIYWRTNNTRQILSKLVFTLLEKEIISKEELAHIIDAEKIER